MRNTTKIQTLTDTLEKLIREGHPDFVDRLPSRRELAVSYRISPASVQIALQELEKRGFVTNFPKKGSRANPRFRRDSAPDGVAENTSEGAIPVTVFETLPHQTGFWLEIFRQFELRNPGCRIEARFCDSNSTAIPAGTRAALRLPRLERIPPAVPLNGIFGAEHLDAIRSGALRQLSDWDWNLYLPYQIQMHALIYRGSDRNSLVPEPGETVTMWLARIHAELGEHAMLPPNNDWLAAVCGVVDAVGRDLAGIAKTAELYNYFNALAFYAGHHLINHQISQDEPHAPLLRSGALSGLVDFTHHWNSFQLLEPGSECQIAPLPFAAGATNGVFVARAALFGAAAVSPAERRFFEFLISADFQLAQMDAMMGLSPFDSHLETELAARRKLAPLIRGCRAQPFRRCTEAVWAELSERLMDPVLLPLIAGEISTDEGIRLAAPLIRQFHGERNSARKHNLRDFLREVV